MSSIPVQFNSVLEMADYFYHRIHAIALRLADERDNLRVELAQLRESLQSNGLTAAEQRLVSSSISDPNVNDTDGIKNFKELLRDSYPADLSDRLMLRLAIFSKLSAEVNRRQNAQIGKF